MKVGDSTRRFEAPASQQGRPRRVDDPTINQRSALGKQNIDKE